MNKQQTEVALRIAITGIQNAVDYLKRVPGWDSPDEVGCSLIPAIDDMNSAMSNIRAFAGRHEITIHKGMPT